jgi:hypothetical protein
MPKRELISSTDGTRLVSAKEIDTSRRYVLTVVKS